MRQEEVLEDERQLAARIVAAARTTAPRLAVMSSISEERNRWVAYKVFFHLAKTKLAPNTAPELYARSTRTLTAALVCMFECNR